MKSYTDIEQSKKLAEILPIESADMFYLKIPNSSEVGYNYSDLPYFASLGIKDNLPCWSLAALLEQLEDAAGLAKDYGFWFCYDNRKSCYTKHYDNPVDACYEMIVKLKEKGLI